MVALLLSQSTAMAAPKPVEVKWSELGAIISGRTVELILLEGPKLRGDVDAVREDALVLDVTKTSDVKAYPKGGATIPRASVTTLKLERPRGHWGRTVGSLGGLMAGAALGGLGDNLTAAFYGAVAGSIAGYYIGKAADKKGTVIRIVP
jgi:hypothetical protein